MELLNVQAIISWVLMFISLIVIRMILVRNGYQIRIHELQNISNFKHYKELIAKTLDKEKKKKLTIFGIIVLVLITNFILWCVLMIYNMLFSPLPTIP
jgi:hypothetical protein